MTNNKLALAVRRALRSGSVVSISTLAVMSAMPAFSAEETLEPVEVVVTGTRIRQVTGMTTPVPVTAVAVEDLKAFNPGAALVDQLDKLPQLFQTESAQRSSGALFGNAGGSYINLRGLGSQRTLKAAGIVVGALPQGDRHQQAALHRMQGGGQQGAQGFRQRKAGIGHHQEHRERRKERELGQRRQALAKNGRRRAVDGA